MSQLSFFQFFFINIVNDLDKWLTKSSIDIYIKI